MLKGEGCCRVTPGMERVLYDTGALSGAQYSGCADVNTSGFCSPQSKNVCILNSPARKQALAIPFHLLCRVVCAYL